MKSIVLVLTLLLLRPYPSAAAGDEQSTITKEAILQWVERYRDAQPQFKPGDIITAADREKVRPFLPPPYFAEFNFPEAEFVITPSGDYSPHPLFRAATERFSSQTRLAADGALEEYIAGQPFANERLDPQDPTAGTKVAWNFNFRWQHYGQKVGNFATVLLRPSGAPGTPQGIPPDLLTGGGTVERVLAQRYQRVYLSHLAMLPEQNYTFPAAGAGQLEWKDITEFTDPYEMRGQRILVQRAADPHLADQAWTYVPSLRKVRRVSAEEKSDSFLGSDTTLDDFYGFSGRVLDYNWKFYGWKYVLHVMNSQHVYPHYYGPKSRVPHDRWELRKCAVIEQIPKDPRHPYSSKILFWDGQTYRTTTAFAFDRDGKLWKIWAAQDSWSEDVQDHPEMNKGTFVARYLGISVIDSKKGQATLFPTFDMGYPEVTPEEVADLYDLNKLTEGKR